MDHLAFSRTVSVRIVPVPFDSLASIACPHCHAGLDLNQPDPHTADRFLGTCGECSVWYLIDLSSEENMAWVVSLAPIAKVAAGVRVKPRQVGG